MPPTKEKGGEDERTATLLPVDWAATSLCPSKGSGEPSRPLTLFLDFQIS